MHQIAEVDDTLESRDADSDEETAELHDGEEPCFCRPCARARSSRSYLFTQLSALANGGLRPEFLSLSLSLFAEEGL